MGVREDVLGNVNRRGFLRGAGSAVAAGMLVGSAEAQQKPVAGAPESIATGSVTRPMSESDKLDRIAANSYPLRWIFKNRNNVGPKDTVQKMQAKYGAITALEYPAYAKKLFPGVTKFDIWSSLFGDITDESQYEPITVLGNDGKPRQITEFNPASANGTKWLEKLAAKQKEEGMFAHHISNNAPRDICELDETKRKAGVANAIKWLDGAAILGAKSMRVNSGGPRIAPTPQPNETSYPKNPELEKYMDQAIKSYSEMAAHGAKVGVKVTLENHWGLTANPINIRTIIEEVNSRWCEASPDFGNWEHKYLVYHALNDLAPYAHTTCHAKFWDRWDNAYGPGTHIDVQRNVRIMMNNGYTGVFALEYEDGPWDGVEGAQYLFKEVLAAL
jgi:sugar phosphate isomerase/epimerase